MNKQKITITLGLIIFVIICIALFLKSQSVTETKRLGNNESAETSISEKPLASNFEELSNEKAISKSKIEGSSSDGSSILAFDSDLKSLREKYPDGVMYTKLSESKLSKVQKEALAKDFDNLNRYGSFSGGKVTNEFSHLDKKRAALKEDKPLDFKPTNTDLLVKNMELTGKWYSGAINDGKYNSLYRLYESQDGRKFEITEMYLNPDNSSIIEVFEESLNYNVNNVPMTIETLKSENGKELYNVHFNHNNRYYSMSTENFNRQQVEKILDSITTAR
ncbi:hypothetical protein F909_02574 [Acinetobacter sp. ANC 3929]|uniref:hypothetical protein n=1 Tax=unclassified Acinetobacter TaxID=196816 RepID=UPI0002D10276|nr:MULTISPECIES: hypothetical protein [unclassified Acinetobacter]ENW81283.1 hypothetical protein F909_02574 [Acinetobacter sp. ANC 3929]MCH7353917.1 hypothetical protein [Acinetobacter sp. NIPH 2023]MCH7356521.1 hypothetical protein [Acinetobacter sp. NIPH 1958]MCH7361252.1 hypothetical protein [Acinetobacter sp. NIPH 2024]